MSKTYKALGVMVLNPSIHSYLESNDPKALKQAEDALSSEHPFRVYVVASRPFPEKVSDNRFYLSLEAAEQALAALDNRFRSSFSIYVSYLTISTATRVDA